MRVYTKKEPKYLSFHLGAIVSSLNNSALNFVSHKSIVIRIKYHLIGIIPIPILAIESTPSLHLIMPSYVHAIRAWCYTKPP